MIRINLLGSLEIWAAGTHITPSAPKLRRVLALLVLNANSLVSVDQLCDELWEDRLPPSALTTLQTYIYQLRRRLPVVEQVDEAPGWQRPADDQLALLTRAGGYELRLNEQQVVDASRFDRLVADGRTLLRAGKTGPAERTLSAALALWRGPALVDVTVGPRLSAWATQLEERRKSAQQDRFAALLELGCHHAVVEELFGAVRMNPTHEGFASQLMLALHRCGRRAEALDVFRSLRAHLVDDLGLEPSTELQVLHQSLLADTVDDLVEAALPFRNAAAEPQGAPASAHPATKPAQLPPEIDHFVGREAELRRLEAHLVPGAGDPETGMRVAEIHGPPGVGKTALAVRLAHRLRRHFPDGQLFVHLPEAATGEERMTTVMTECLRACGLGLGLADIPASLPELSRLFRSWTADRRVLVVLDDVISPAQARPLAPGGGGCALVATNRYRTQGLSTGLQITLSALTEDQAVSLFRQIVGDRRCADEIDVIRDLVTMCGRLPLTVCAVAARLASRPGWSAARLARRLHEDDHMLPGLPAGGGQSLAQTIGSSYWHMPARQRAALRMLSADHRASWPVNEIADLLGVTVDEAEGVADHLVDAHLAEELTRAPARPPSARGRCEAAAGCYTVPQLTRMALRVLLKPDGNGAGRAPSRSAETLDRVAVLP